ncbi:MAG: PDZ domain-containing protein [Gemmatimonadota bacterium]|nr:PDZ domain-containing protein [Gemmatimonadota bacterium]
MTIKRDLRIASALLFVALPVAAQQSGACNAGPGAAFGVTAYQCASCGFKHEKQSRPEYLFQAEPVLLETTSASLLKPGDIIEAVNEQPITTRAGAEQFTYPRAGESVLSVRRNGQRVRLVVRATDVCRADEAVAPTPAAPAVPAAPTPEPSIHIRSVVPATPATRTLQEPVYIVDGVVMDSTMFAAGFSPLRPSQAPLRIVDGLHSDAASASPFGFAVSCGPFAGRFGDIDPADIESIEVVKGAAAAALYGPAANYGAIVVTTKRGRSVARSCTKATASDGTIFWKYDGYPPIVALRAGGPAAVAGIQVGDTIAEIDGISILDESGALRFLRASKSSAMNVTVLRDGKRLTYLLKVR